MSGLEDYGGWLRYQQEENNVPDERHRRLQEKLQQAMQQELTPRQREVVYLYYYERKKTPAIASELHINRSTAWRTLKRAVSRLEATLKYAL